MKTPITISVFLVLLSSCYSYKIYPIEIRNYTYSGDRKKAYVLNPQLKKEYKILQSSNIFEIVSDSLDITAIKINLQPLKKRYACGQPITASLITLGQVPVLLPDCYKYSFEEIAGTNSTSHFIEMHIATRVWFWDMFIFKKKFNQKAGQVLLAKYYAD